MTAKGLLGVIESITENASNRAKILELQGKDSTVPRVVETTGAIVHTTLATLTAIIVRKEGPYDSPQRTNSLN